jgi:HPt (histidine-containing phosphotransfer) domain-containing protein
MGCPQPAPQEALATAAPAPPSANDDIVSAYRDDPDMAVIIADFVPQLPQRLVEMRQAAANNQWEILQRLAHQIKGAGGSYGYACLTDEARDLETHARQQDAEAAMLCVRRLELLCQRILAGHAPQAVPEKAAQP